MADFVETYIERIREKKFLRKLLLFFSNFLKRSEKYTSKGKIHIEIEKSKLERRKKYFELGKYVSKMYIKEKVIDFSYKEDFFIINKDIKTINDYLKKLSKDKDSI
tara:strand:+ start:277 stop:594 length:318 start_codon:yes stop_codon:yes gene_type:complete